MVPVTGSRTWSMSTAAKGSSGVSTKLMPSPAAAAAVTATSYELQLLGSGAGELIRVIAAKGGLGPMVHAPNQPPDHPLQPCAQGHQRRRWVCKVASQYGR